MLPLLMKFSGMICKVEIGLCEGHESESLINDSGIYCQDLVTVNLRCSFSILLRFGGGFHSLTGVPFTEK